MKLVVYEGLCGKHVSIDLTRHDSTTMMSHSKLAAMVDDLARKEVTAPDKEDAVTRCEFVNRKSNAGPKA